MNLIKQLAKRGGRTLKSTTSRKNLIILILVVAFVLISFSSTLINLYTDYLWFNQIGFVSVFSKIITLQIYIGVVIGIIVLAFLYVNMLIAKKMAPEYPYWFGSPESISYQIMRVIKSPLFMRFFNLILLLVALFFAFTIGLSSSTYWETFLRYLNQASFGIKDPIFNLDISFHIFTIPFYRALLGIAYRTLILAIVLTALVHWINGGITLGPTTRRIEPHTKAHLSILFALFFVLLAISYKLNAYDLLQSAVGVVYGAGYTDIHAKLPALNILFISSLISALLFLINIHYRGWKLPALSIGFMMTVGILAGFIYPALVQQYSVSPNEIVKETPFIKHSIDFTNKAYGLDSIKENTFEANLSLDQKSLENSKDTIENIRLWDWQPLLKTYNQIQSIRLYYNFLDVDVDRYDIEGKTRQIALAVRELNTENLPENARTWVNQHLVYTHGYGIVANKVNEFTEDGLPNLIIEDIPPKSTVPSLNITRPEIYFGETEQNYVIVKTKTKEFDYPIGTGNKYTTYKGKDGVELNSFIRKALFAWRFGTLKLLLSDSITNESKVLLYRNISERVNKITPFLSLDNDPYIVVDNGKLYWIVDAYTLDSRYPYSQPYDDEHNYIRNSVKIVVDAYNGTVDYYLFDNKDPLVNAYKKAFPGLFKDKSEMPKGIIKHLRYPETLFAIQSQMFSIFHMKDPQVFYNKEDMWAISKDQAGGEQKPIEPYFMQMVLPNESKPKFILLNTFTPTNKSNMIAWMAVKCDPEEYGQMLVYNLPKQKLVYGPMQIDARINQTPDISQQLTLWNQQGSRAIRGNIFVIPINDSILYVEPLYLQSEQTELPELKRVIVAYGPKIVMEKDLTTALASIFGKAEPEKPTPEEPGKQPSTPQTLKSLAEKAKNLFIEAQEKLRQGDWAGYGQAQKELEEVINEIEKAAK